MENGWFRAGTRWEEVDMDRSTVLDYQNLKAEDLETLAEAGLARVGVPAGPGDDLPQDAVSRPARSSPPSRSASATSPGSKGVAINRGAADGEGRPRHPAAHAGSRSSWGQQMTIDRGALHYVGYRLRHGSPRQRAAVLARPDRGLVAADAVGVRLAFALAYLIRFRAGLPLLDTPGTTASPSTPRSRSGRCRSGSVIFVLYRPLRSAASFAGSPSTRGSSTPARSACWSSSA